MTNVKRQDYKLSNPKFYDCKLTADYIICGGYDADKVPNSQYVNNKVDMWIHFIKRVDGEKNGDGKSIMFEYQSNDDVYPVLYPKKPVRRSELPAQHHQLY